MVTRLLINGVKLKTNLKKIFYQRRTIRVCQDFPSFYFLYFCFFILVIHYYNMTNILTIQYKTSIILSSPELKAQVRFLIDCLPSVRPSVNFSHFHLFFQNHLANFKHFVNLSKSIFE